MRLRRACSLLYLAVLVAGWLLGCSKSSDGGASVGTELPDEIVTNFVTEESDSGRAKWRLASPLAKRFNQQKVFVMEHPQIEFFDDYGALRTTLNAENGEYSQETHDMLAWGDVVVVSVEGDVLETDTLRYLNEKDRIVSDSFVRLTRGLDVLTGYGLECDHNLNSVDIQREVKATIIDPKGEVRE